MVGALNNKVEELVRCVKNGRFHQVTALLDAGASVDTIDPEGNRATLLLLASVYGHTEIVAELLRRGANVNHRDIHGETALSWVSENHTAIVKLLRNAGVPMTLMSAAKLGDLEAIRKFHQQGVNINQSNTMKTTPLIEAAKHGHLEVVSALLEYGAEIDKGDQLGTALAQAANDGHLSVVQKLIASKANINGHFQSGSPLAMAACSGHLEVVSVLLAHQADIDAKDSVGMTALMEAAQGCHSDVIKLLIEKGADINIVDVVGNTALSIAAGNGCSDAVKMLLEAKKYLR